MQSPFLAIPHTHKAPRHSLCHSSPSSRASLLLVAAYSPPMSSMTSRHSGLGSCRHCFSTSERAAAAVYLCRWQAQQHA